MKRLIALLLSIIMALTGCGQVQPQKATNDQTEPPTVSAENNTMSTELIVKEAERLDSTLLESSLFLYHYGSHRCIIQHEPVAVTSVSFCPYHGSCCLFHAG